MAEEIKRIHLKDLIAPGKEVSIKIVDPDTMEEAEAVVFMHKPSATQQQEAISKARASAARRRAIMRDKESDEYLSIKSQVDEADIKELVETLVSFRAEELRIQAREEVLHSDEIGSDWGDEGNVYYDNAEAMALRTQELQIADDEDFDPSQDEELRRLGEIHDQFWGEVNDRYASLKEIEATRIKMEKTPEQMRDEVFKKLIDTEYNITWMQEYQLNMLFASVRHPDNKKKLYFSSIDELVNVPEYVLDQLWQGFNEINTPGDQVKNSRSLPRS